MQNMRYKNMGYKNRTAQGESLCIVCPDGDRAQHGGFLRDRSVLRERREQERSKT